MVCKEVRDMLKQEALPTNRNSSMGDLVLRPCAYCKGTGEVELGVFVPYYEPCPVCEEGREVRVPENYVECRKCEGTGKEDVGEYIQWFMPCEKCHGAGWSPPPPVYDNADHGPKWKRATFSLP